MSVGRTVDWLLVTGSVLILCTLLGFGVWTAKKSSQANVSQAIEILYSSSRAMNEFDRMRFTAQRAALGDPELAEDSLANAFAMAKTWAKVFHSGEIENVGDPAVIRFSTKIIDIFARIETVMGDPSCDTVCRGKKLLRLTKRGKREAAKLQGRGLILDRQTRHSLSALNAKTLQMMFAGCAAFMAFAALLAFSTSRKNHELRQQKMQLIETQHRLLEIGQYRAQFLAGMSHEFRTPLNAIKGFSQFILMMKEKMPLDQMLDYIKDIEKSATDLVSITNSVLDLSKIDAGSIDLHEEKVDLAELVWEVRHQFSADHGAKRIHVEAPTSLMAYCDTTAIKRCVQNAVANSLKFSPSDSVIEVRLSVSEAGATFTISDRGCGIPAEELEAVWQVYSRSSYTRGSDKQGSGLGLPIIKGLIESHGGTVHLESEINVGTVMSLTLPPERLRLATEGDRQAAA